MSYFQATMNKPHGMLTAYRPVAGLGRTHKLLGRQSMCLNSTRSCKPQQKLYPRLVLVSACHKRLGPVYATSGKENSELVNDVSIFVALPELYSYIFHFMQLSCNDCFFSLMWSILATFNVNKGMVLWNLWCLLVMIKVHILSFMLASHHGIQNSGRALYTAVLLIN
jgi:hypothetical protein